jgi:hypothetical protein
METEPSIRGMLVRQTIDWLGSLVVARRTTPQALGVRLEAMDMQLFTAGLAAHAWVPISTSARLDSALVRAHGGDSDAVMREIGARWANRWPLPDLRGGGGVTGRSALPDPADLFSETQPIDFGRWRTLEGTPSGFELALEDAHALPDTTRFQLEGLVSAALARHMGMGIELESRRPSPGQIVFRGRISQRQARPERRGVHRPGECDRRLTG